MRYQFGSGCDLSVPLCAAARTGLHAIEPLNLRPELVSAVPPPPTSSGRARRWLVLYPRAIPLVIFLALAAASVFFIVRLALGSAPLPAGFGV